MAKKYISYEELALRASSVESTYKPYGTLGTHNATIRLLSGGGIEVKGSAKGSLQLFPGETLGYNCGEIWRVPNPECYGNPLRRLLAERKLGQRLLEYSSGPVTVHRHWQEACTGSCADVECGESAEALGGTYVFGPEEVGPERAGYNPSRGYEEYYSGFKALIVRRVETSGHNRLTKCRATRVTRIVVHPDHKNDPEILEFLRKKL